MADIDSNDPEVFGELGPDAIIGGPDAQVIYGDDFVAPNPRDVTDGGDDDISAADGDDTVYGQGGNDTLRGEIGNDTLYGGVGNDILVGGEGVDFLDGGEGDDLLDPGPNGSVVPEVVDGGGGEDTVVLRGTPGNYTYSLEAPAVGRITGLGGVANEDVTLTNVEQVAFGVTAEQLADGATPLTVVDFNSLFPGSSSDGVGVPSLAFSDTISAAFGTTRVLIDLRDIRSNDYDPDGGVQELVGFNTITPAGVSASALLNATDVDAAGFDSALYPFGLLVVDITSPLTAPFRLQYRTVLEDQASGTSDTSSEATITINPAQAVDDRLLGSFGAETFIPYAQLLSNDGPGAVFGGISNAYVFGGTIRDDPGRGGIVIAFPGFYRSEASFEYSLRGVTGTALAVVDLNNSPPITTPIARVVTPGTSLFLGFDDIRYKAGNFDPDDTGQPTLVQVSGAAGAGVTYSLSATGIDLTFAPTYSGGFSLDYTLSDQPLLARSLPSTISFLTVEPPPPVTISEVLNWGINSDGRTLFQGGVPGFGTLYARELLANDMVMPGTVASTGINDTTITVENLALKTIQYGIPGVNGSTSRSDTGFGFEFKSNFTGSETYQYWILDPLGRSATGEVTLNVIIPQPVVRNDVILVAAGATSVTVTAAQVLGNDTYFGAGPGPGTGAIAEINANVLNTVADSGVDIGGGKTRIDSFSFDLDPARAPNTYQFNIRTFDTAAAGGSANGYQTVTFATGAPTSYRFAELSETFQEGFAWGFILERSGVLDEAEVSFTIRSALSGPSADGSDVGGFDIQSQATFGVGQSSVTIGGGIVDDALVEPNESFRVTLDLVRGVGGGSNPGVIDPAASVFVATILDNDLPPPPAIAFNAASLGSTPEGNTFDGRLLFEIVRQGPDLGAAATVRFEIAGGTVSADDFYVLRATPVGAGTLAGSLGLYEVTFGVGEFLAEVEVFANRDTALERDETFTLQLTSVSGFGSLSTTGPLSASGIFTNDDLPPPPPAIAFNAASLGSTPEGNTADSRLLFEVVRNGPDLGAATTVVFEIAGGTVSADDVYVLGATRLGDGTLAGSLGRYEVGFGVGEFLAEVEVFANRDTTVEPNETVTLQLTSVSGFGTLSTTGPLVASGIFTNDDLPPPPPPQVGFELADQGSVAEGNPGDLPVALPFAVVRTGDTTLETVLRFTVAGDVAADDIIVANAIRVGDGPAGTLGLYEARINADETGVGLFIAPVRDRTPEADETVRVTLTDIIANGTLSGITESVGAILNDDLPPEIAFAAADVGSTPEGNGTDGRLAFVLARTGDLTAASTVLVEIAGGGVSEDDVYVLGASFVAPGGTDSLGFFQVEIAAGAAEATIEVFSASDRNIEPDEDVVVRLVSILSNGTVSPAGAAVARGTILNDDAPPPPVFHIVLAENVATEDTPPGTGGRIAFAIERLSGAAGAATITYTLSGGAGDAAMTDDIVGGFGSFTVTIGEGVSSVPIFVTALPDATFEPDESVRITLTGTSFGSINPIGASAEGLIINDDLRDSDADGVPDNRDNAILVPNPDQRDTDGDGYGNVIDADFNQDMVVDFFDLSIMASLFFSDNPDADLNGDGQVDFFDLSILEELFGKAPGSSHVDNLAPPSTAAMRSGINADETSATNAVTAMSLQVENDGAALDLGLVLQDALGGSADPAEALPGKSPSIFSALGIDLDLLAELDTAEVASDGSIPPAKSSSVFESDHSTLVFAASSNVNAEPHPELVL